MSLRRLRRFDLLPRLLALVAASLAIPALSQNLLTNGDFDLDYGAWTAAGTGSVLYRQFTGSPTAGALQLRATAGTTESIGQCVAIAAPASIDFGARSVTDLSSGDSASLIGVTFFAQTGCAGEELGSLTTTSYSFEPPDNAAHRRSTGVAVPAGTQSAMMIVTAFGGRTGQMIITFDHLVLGPAGAWSCVVWPTPLTLPSGTSGVEYTQALSGNGGTGPYTFELAAGALPQGVTLSPSGVLSGTPAVGGSFAITIRVTDSAGCAGQRSYLLGFPGDPPLGANSNFQGIWWAAPPGWESGWGINFAHQGDIIFVTWFTFGPDGKPMWMVAAATKTSNGVYTGDLYTGTGPAFNSTPFDPAAVDAIKFGTVTLTFTDNNNASFVYTFGGLSVSKQITRQQFGATMPICTWGAQPDLALATNYQDMWWASPPPGVESGWGINFAHQGDTVFATWFTFGADGKPLWLVVAAFKVGDGVYSGTLYTATGPPFFAVPFNSSQVAGTPVGTATLTFTDGNNATFAYNVNGVQQVKQLTRQVFSPPGTVCQ